MPGKILRISIILFAKAVPVSDSAAIRIPAPRARVLLADL